MSFDKSIDSTQKSKASRVHSEKDIGPLSFNDELQFKSADEYIMDVMEQTQINLRRSITLKHADKVNCVAFSLDGKYAASGSDDKTIKVWNLKEMKNEFTLNSLTNNSSSIREGC